MFIYLLGIIALGHVVSSLPPDDSPGERYPMEIVTDPGFGNLKTLYGEDAEPPPPFFAVILFITSYNYDRMISETSLCLGSSIAEHWILLPAHCLCPSKSYNTILEIKIGGPNSPDSCSATVLTAGNWSTHPRYDPAVTGFNDVGLIYSPVSLKIGLGIGAIPFASIQLNLALTVYGGGLTENRRQAMILKKANGTVVDMKFCVKKWNENGYKKIEHSREHSLMCMTGRMCEANFKVKSGGQVIQTDGLGKHHLIGIVIYGIDGRYLCEKVSSHEEWITSVIGGY